MPIFRVKSEKIYTDQKKFTQAPLVVLVTNIRYAYNILYYIVFENSLELELSLKNWPPLVHASFCPGAVI